jgi:hypothetical protein
MVISSGFVMGQSDELGNKKNSVQFQIINGDTVYIANLAAIFIFPPKKFDHKHDYDKYQKLIRNLKTVYPYAVMAKQKLIEMNKKFLSLKTAREKQEYAKQVEVELRAQYEQELRQLTITQGRLLIKLVDRETGQTTYTLVKEVRGTFSAVFWQTIARFFGSSLKSKYDPQGEDKLTEEILILIESGQL